MRDFLNLPIGVIDSGIGGLSVLDRLIKAFPNESFLYYGDNDNSPYGNKPLSFVKERIEKIVETLYKRGVKGIVIACNTASTHFYKDIKNAYPFFVIPTFPPIVKGKGVYLACTSNTAKSDYVKKHYKSKVIAFPRLAKTIENNVFNLDDFNVYPYFEKLNKKIEVLVLGCTHYSFISDNIKRQLGIKTIDGYDIIVNNLKFELQVRKMSSNSAQKITFLGEKSTFNKRVFERVFCHTGGYQCKKN